ncbi:spermatogenesis-associated protein 22 isoform X2 [Phycodurus eques]|uniref:spermatogenesis-associated protein 22 isoform X2 n=1 Tax=Phycodurus eques TaxID=693459 RepID=UPI002ACED0DF|nr:spermatogenesis-associated protein 22 isoform X2 [Phycodurus eques]
MTSFLTCQVPAHLLPVVHQVPLLMCVRVTSGTNKTSHDLLSPNNMAAIDLHQQRDLTHLYHIRTKLEVQICFVLSSMMGTASNPERQQDARSIFTFRQKQYQTPSSGHSGFSRLSQQPSYRPPDPTQFRSLPPPAQLSSGPATQIQNKWNFTNSFGPQKPTFVGNRSANKPQTPQETQTQESVPKKAPFDSSLRILTAVIEGMRHWSQFKDKVLYFFELFATLDSAVTLGHHGSKNFLLRDGKQVVQCVFYENERELPRLIRGQVHRCVGNYDRSKDVLVCVSVRAAKPSEVSNAPEAIKACDAHMRKLVRLLHEV